jgi:hypothetical protein
MTLLFLAGKSRDGASWLYLKEQNSGYDFLPQM